MILRDGQTLPAAVGMDARNNDELKTEAGCMADVSLNGLAGCRVLPSSHCRIVNTATDGMSVKIESGNAILNLEKLPKGSTFQVETPTALATVRGTQFWGRVERSSPDNPVTTFAVREGVVQVTPKGFNQNFSLQKGQALDIPKDTKAAPVMRPALPEEMDAMQQASEIRTSA